MNRVFVALVIVAIVTIVGAIPQAEKGTDAAWNLTQPRWYDATACGADPKCSGLLLTRTARLCRDQPHAFTGLIVTPYVTVVSLVADATRRHQTPEYATLDVANQFGTYIHVLSSDVIPHPVIKHGALVIQPSLSDFHGVNRLAFRSQSIRRNKLGFGSGFDAVIEAAKSDYLFKLPPSAPSREPFKVVLEGKLHTETCDIDPATFEKLR
jgi:hypothetical protein